MGTRMLLGALSGFVLIGGSFLALRLIDEFRVRELKEKLENEVYDTGDYIILPDSYWKEVK